jgi:hypothetical protein
MKSALQMNDVKTATQRIFDTRDGKLLMEYLSRTYYDSPIKGDNVIRELGSRDVILRLKQLIEE